jgi:predicted ABC-class ATPase
MARRTISSHASEMLCAKKANVDDCPVDRKLQADPAGLADRIDHRPFTQQREADDPVSAVQGARDCAGSFLEERQMLILVHRNQDNPRFDAQEN